MHRRPADRRYRRPVEPQGGHPDRRHRLVGADRRLRRHQLLRLAVPDTDRRRHRRGDPVAGLLLADQRHLPEGEAGPGAVALRAGHSDRVGPGAGHRRTGGHRRRRDRAGRHSAGGHDPAPGKPCSWPSDCPGCCWPCWRSSSSGSPNGTSRGPRSRAARRSATPSSSSGRISAAMPGCSWEWACWPCMAMAAMPGTRPCFSASTASPSVRRACSSHLDPGLRHRRGLFAGWLSDRLLAQGRRDAHYLVSIGYCLGFAVTGAVGSASGSPYICFPLIAISLAFSNTIIGVVAAALQILTPPRMRGLISSLFLAIAAFVGFAFGPSAIGFATVISSMTTIWSDIRLRLSRRSSRPWARSPSG